MPEGGSDESGPMNWPISVAQDAQSAAKNNNVWDTGISWAKQALGAMWLAGNGLRISAGANPALSDLSQQVFMLSMIAKRKYMFASISIYMLIGVAVLFALYMSLH